MENRFCKNLKEIRDFLKIDLRDLAIRCGINYAQLNRYECGHNEPSLSSLLKIANALGVSLDRLVK